MKLNKICLCTLTPIVAAIPALSTSCSLFADSAWKIYKEGNFNIGTSGKFGVTTKPDKIIKDQDLVINFTNTVKYKEKLVYKDLDVKNVYTRYKISADSWTTPMQISTTDCTVENNTVTIRKEFVNNILEYAKGQSKYEPTLELYLMDFEVNEGISWADIGELSDTPEEAMKIFDVGTVIPITVNGQKQYARIVDFNKYKDVNSGKTATFVFQLTEAVMDSTGSPITSIWDNKIETSFFIMMKYYYNYNYSNSVVADKVNGDITNWVKAGLGSAASKMKRVYKSMAYSDVKPSEYNLFRSVDDYKVKTDPQVYCFLPSITNIIASPSKAKDNAFYYNTGTLFQFYARTKSAPIKRNSNIWAYWTDSPDVNEYNGALYTDGNTCGSDNIQSSKKAIVPCFCI